MKSAVERNVPGRTSPRLNDVIVSKVRDGHLLLVVAGEGANRMSLVYRGEAWNVQYAVARAARLVSGKGGSLWYTTDEMATLEYLETFAARRADAQFAGVDGR
ncbi:MAG TPA: hypothetical protein VHJ77_09800 [Vicinamibacterales bacterium]|jgi:hypothetical protein|nr:hypothetical protein [Vicinamibacterales bacterium]